MLKFQGVLIMFILDMLKTMLKISVCVENCLRMLKTMLKFQGVLKMFMLGMLKTMLKTVLKDKKNTITLYGAC